MKLKFTREYSDGEVKLIVHTPGGRPLSMDLPAGNLRWSVTFAHVPTGTQLLDGDVEAMHSRANALGRPLKRGEVESLLLARRLLGNP